MSEEMNVQPFDYKYMYDLYTMCGQNDDPDIGTITIPKFREANPDAMTDADSKQYREFIGAYGPELAKAFDTMNKAQFDAYVKDLAITDTEVKEEDKD